MELCEKYNSGIRRKPKVGDIVYIREDLEGGEHYDGVYCNTNMLLYTGEQHVVTRVISSAVYCHDGTVYQLGNGGRITRWVWAACMLEVVVYGTVL